MDWETKRFVALAFSEIAFSQSRLGLQSIGDLATFLLSRGFEVMVSGLETFAIPSELETKFYGILRRYENLNLPVNSIDNLSGEMQFAGIKNSSHSVNG